MFDKIRFAKNKPNMVIIPQSRKKFAEASVDEPDWGGPPPEKKRKSNVSHNDWDEKPATWDLEWSPERPDWESANADVADGASKDGCFE